jgi:hypothetical protein
VNLNRHRGQCSICSHEKRKETEAAFVAWESPDSIVAEHGLALSMARRPLLYGAFGDGSIESRIRNTSQPIGTPGQHPGDESQRYSRSAK